MLAAAVAGIAAAAPVAPGRDTRTRATALVAQVSVPGQAGGATTQVVAPPTASGGGAFAVSGRRIRPPDRRVDRHRDGASRARRPRRRAAINALAVSAFGGEVTADSVNVRAGAAAGAAGATGDVGTSTINGLAVLGQAVTPSGNVQLPLADWGTLDVLVLDALHVGRAALGRERGDRPPHPADRRSRRASRRDGDRRRHPRPRAPSRRRRRRPHRRRTSTARRAPRRRRRRGRARRRRALAPPANAPKEPGRSIPGAPPEVVRAAPEVTARLSQRRLRLPGLRPRRVRQHLRRVPRRRRREVAPRRGPRRAATARRSSPSRTGRSSPSAGTTSAGWRLWLRDDAGNEFYYAHLSALLAARHRREAREGGRRARLRRRLGRRATAACRTCTSRSIPSTSSATATTARSRRTRSSSRGGARRTSRSPRDDLRARPGRARRPAGSAGRLRAGRRRAALGRRHLDRERPGAGGAEAGARRRRGPLPREALGSSPSSLRLDLPVLRRLGGRVGRVRGGVAASAAVVSNVSSGWRSSLPAIMSSSFSRVCGPVQGL